MSRTAPFVVVGSYDSQKHRARILLAGLRQLDVAIHEVNVPIWSGIRDKGTLSLGEKCAAGARQLLALPRLMLGYLRAPAHDVVLIPYPGVFEVLAIAPLASLRGARVAWDVFISPFDTMVHDRRSHAPWHPLPVVLRVAEWCAARLATWVFLDTQAHARRFEELLSLREGSVGAVQLGTDPQRFPPRPRGPRVAGPLRVLFYGQYIPLHGMETIVRAAHRVEQRGVAVQWTFAGTGQEQARVTALIASLGVQSITQLGWIAPERLPALMHECDVGLGIFGTSAKAQSVIPNKAYELAAAQVPIVTGATAAIAEFAVGHPWMIRVSSGDDEALADAVMHIATHGLPTDAPPLPIVGPPEVAAQLLAFIERAQ